MNEKIMLWFTLLNICVCTANNNIIENISVNCGSSGASTSENGKKWLGDITTRSLTSVRVEGSSTTSTQKLNNAVDLIPYKTARASRSSFSYEFQASPGEKIIRLHFSPGSYKGFQRLMDLIDVEAGQFTLLGNFSASLTAEALGVKSFVKEFCMNVEENRLLRITFSPANGDAYAFINGIEVISVPNALSYFGVSAFEVVGRKSLVHDLDRNGALEHVYRWNAKTELYLASRNNDDDLFLTWTTEKDDNKVKNDTFKVLADVGFNYLIRLHFSELILLKRAARDELIFKVFIGETLAQSNIDLFKKTGENSMARHGDYLVTMRGQKNDGKSHLLISVESSDGSRILEGLEILKLANTDNSLASPNPAPVPQRSLDNSIIMMTVKYILSVIGYKNAIFAIVTAIVSVASIIVCELQEISEASSVVDEVNKPSERAQRICPHFSLDEIRSATKFYSVDLIIGRGGFGSVYKGTIDGGRETVAVKKLKLDSRQGAREFLAEIETLSELRHVNLVPLIGYCNEYCEMMLVYMYMSGGTLADHLYKNARKNKDCCPALTWKQRLNICIGAARGLDYLHTGHGIIHRDIKSSNILLDENLEAKVSDFGLAKPEDRSKSQSHVSTNVKGTFGYLDPHYCITRKLTRKSDTYAFGVVLFEVLCGRPALSSKLAEDERVLVNWVQGKIKEDTDQIVDPSLREEISPDSLKIYVEVAERCINIEPKKRPTMSQVVVQLEIALELQESEAFTASNEKTFASNDNQSLGDATGLSNIEEEVKLTSSDDKNRSEEKQNETTEAAGLALPSADNYARKDKMNKSPWIWPVGAFWERVRFSRTNVLRESGMYTQPLCVCVCISGFAGNYNITIVIIVASIAGLVIIVITGRIIFKKRRKQQPARENIENGDEISTVESLREDFRKIRSATNDFSDENKLGQGGFGAVYKGKLQNEKEIAVKRLSKNSGQGYLEFKNEVLLLARLQHRNLVRLLGFSIEGEEKLLVYEFVQNVSLDQFIFGPVKKSRLDWDRRSKIIGGIARGLLYLHEDSRLRIIHRDLKASNVLLDSEMNAKIADFGMARLFARDDQTQGITCRVVGTYGYMAPEYAMHGQFSIKSDVFSFGVLLLEIVSGQKNKFRNGQDNSIQDLLSVVWKSWREGTAVNIIDPILKSDSGSTREMLRCIHIGLLCVQENAADRPTMASVLLMLSSLSVTLSFPSEPAFFMRGYEMESGNIRSESDEKKLIDSSHSRKSEMSKNEASITELYPR